VWAEKSRVINGIGNTTWIRGAAWENEYQAKEEEIFHQSGGEVDFK